MIRKYLWALVRWTVLMSSPAHPPTCLLLFGICFTYIAIWPDPEHADPISIWMFPVIGPSFLIAWVTCPLWMLRFPGFEDWKISYK